MARLRSKRTGVIVNVPDDKVALLAHRYEAVAVATRRRPPKPKPAEPLPVDDD
ncbi:hypothetical protein [Rhodococcus rhodnii]|uniref:Uncharacterized protein n=1 Tax=Rhodococcus rhodnii LMG 5362 TaxID=1273125 RepID=R7WUU9_9NOCA|nr:hypothetical protein [Rhodococcus rhodnii]EOM77909.1 hypothetical protein Rrhod_0718 [Rhodococcus rhodnii LMG 5362]